MEKGSQAKLVMAGSSPAMTERDHFARPESPAFLDIYRGDIPPDFCILTRLRQRARA
jgi:hypothetical protein